MGQVDRDEELAMFPKIVVDAKNKFPGEADMMILGDLNADCGYFNENQQIELKNSDQYKWLPPK